MILHFKIFIHTTSQQFFYKFIEKYYNLINLIFFKVPPPCLVTHLSQRGFHCCNHVENVFSGIICNSSIDFCFIYTIVIFSSFEDLILRNKKVGSSQIKRVRESRNCHILFFAKVPNDKYRMSRTIILVQHPFTTGSKFRSLPSNTFTIGRNW